MSRDTSVAGDGDRVEEELIGLVPAAGKGLRLGLPYPKELYPIIRNNKYKPVAEHVIDNLRSAGVAHVVFVVNETKHQLLGYFGSGRAFGCELSYVVQDPVEERTGGSSGLAEALDSAWHLTRGRSVLFGMADTIITPQQALAPLRAREHGKADLVLALFETEHPEKFGMVERNGADGARIARIVDKPRTTDLRWMWGAILWRPRFTAFLHEHVARGGSQDFAAIMNRAIEAGLEARGVELAGARYVDVGTYDEIAKLEREFREESH